MQVVGSYKIYIQGLLLLYHFPRDPTLVWNGNSREAWKPTILSVVQCLVELKSIALRLQIRSRLVCDVAFATQGRFCWRKTKERFFFSALGISIKIKRKGLSKDNTADELQNRSLIYFYHTTQGGLEHPYHFYVTSYLIDCDSIIMLLAVGIKIKNFARKFESRCAFLFFFVIKFNFSIIYKYIYIFCKHNCGKFDKIKFPKLANWNTSFIIILT